MPKKIKVTPLAEESFGVRSMCTHVETSDIQIILDAGASLAPKRNGYPPHPKEYDALAQCRKRINKAAKKIYNAKLVLAKSYRSKVNASQRGR